MGRNSRKGLETTYEGMETYLRSEIEFLEKYNNPEASFVLEVGFYTYPFKIKLPLAIPSTLDERHGRIKYFLQATVSIPWSRDLNFILPIVIINRLDLNTLPILRHQTTREYEKLNRGVCCNCNASANIAKITLIVKRGGYTPGESILFDVQIDNRSNKEVNKIDAYLVQLVRFNAKTKTKVEANVLTSLNVSSIVPPKNYQCYSNCKIYIPNLVVPSSNGTSGVIDVTYRLTLSNFPEHLYVPIIIGSIRFNRIDEPDFEDVFT